MVAALLAGLQSDDFNMLLLRLGNRTQKDNLDCRVLLWADSASRPRAGLDQSQCESCVAAVDLNAASNKQGSVGSSAAERAETSARGRVGNAVEDLCVGKLDLASQQLSFSEFFYQAGHR